MSPRAMSDPGCERSNERTMSDEVTCMQVEDLSQRWASEFTPCMAIKNIASDKTKSGSRSHSRVNSGSTSVPTSWADQEVECSIDQMTSTLDSLPMVPRVEEMMDNSEELYSRVGPKVNAAVSSIPDALLKANIELYPAVMGPGSLGHPEFCARPCLFYMAGTCKSGTECNFCHEAHTKREPHLDKRHRQLFQTASMPDRFAMLLPVVQAKLAFCPEKAQLVNTLHQILAISQAGNYVPCCDRNRKIVSSLQHALMTMRTKSLLAMVCQTKIPADALDGQVLVALLDHVAEQIAATDAAAHVPTIATASTDGI